MSYNYKWQGESKKSTFKTQNLVVITMKKTIFLILCLAFTNLVSFSQVKKEVQTDSKAYSESVPYKPTEFPNSNYQKDKKSKNKDDKKSDVNEKKSDNSVIVPVSVFDNQGKIILKLNKSDFQLYADDIEIGEFSLENVEQPLNIILLLDSSPSAEFKIKEYQDYAAKIVEELEPQDKVMIAEFNETLKIRTDFTSDRKIANTAIRKINFGNGTSLYDSLQNFFEEKVSDTIGRTAIILVTDGVDTTSTKSSYVKSLQTGEKYNVPVFVTYIDSLEHYVKSLKNSGAVLLSSPPFITNLPSPQKNSLNLSDSIKLEYEIGKYYLNDLISLSGGRVSFFKNSPESQNETIPNFIQEMRLKYYLKFKPSETDKTGERKQIKVRVNRPNLIVSAKGSYITN